MSTENNEKPNLDPFAPVVQFSDLWMKSWADVLSQTVASQGFAESMGEHLEGFMEATKLMRQQVKVTMEQALEQANMPSREQVVGLAERVTHVEMVLDDVEVKVDESLELLRSIQAALDAQK
jgi:hypothetical protein